MQCGLVLETWLGNKDMKRQRTDPHTEKLGASEPCTLMKVNQLHNSRETWCIWPSFVSIVEQVQDVDTEGSESGVCTFCVSFQHLLTDKMKAFPIL